MNYNILEIEKKWQKFWSNNPIAKTKDDNNLKKFYCLDMFPYPSGTGLHVGHWRGYVLSDVYARMKWLQGFNVLHPMGWDAFGLPAENDAIKRKINPAISTASNIATFKKQLTEVAAIYDWSKELNTTDPSYYKWTQWIFLKMYKAGLAYEANMPINWCTSCLTGLSNEEVVQGACERCGSDIEHKNIRQWVLKITDYAEKLLEGLDKLPEWPEKVKNMQRNWIGKSEGVEVTFKVKAPGVPTGERNNWINVPAFTTRVDTLYGVTFIAMAPNHDLVPRIIDPNKHIEIMRYQELIDSMTNVQRLESIGTADEKTGIFTGTYALHPLTNENIPVYLANYVLKDYGTGVVMGVPAHCERDFEFAKLFNLPAKVVIDSPAIKYDESGQLEKAYEGDGVLINSECFSGVEANILGKDEITRELEKINLGLKQTKYKLRDWIFSRQRYWGEPIPIIHCPLDGIVPVPEDQLPVILPEVENYQPTGTGESPLANITEWVNTTCPTCKGPAKRETNTMPQWAGSSWYFLRYINPSLENSPFDPEQVKYWMPVDLYVGGIEHAILHLLYARFFTKVLYDQGYISIDEPFKQLFNQGMITKYSEKSGLVEKMSKSKGNVVNPDDIVKIYGSDVLRMYMLFMGPPEQDCEWQDSGLEGIKRFLNKFWGFFMEGQNNILDKNTSEDLEDSKRIHRFIKDFEEKINSFKPNTAIAAFMEFLNDVIKYNIHFSPENAEKIFILLSILAPHTASEMLAILSKKNLQDCSWPEVDYKLAEKDVMEIAIQVNGKTRSVISMPVDASEDAIKKAAEIAVSKWIQDKKIIKFFYAKGRLINFIVN